MSKHWIETYEGRRFDLAEPRPNDVHLADIAHSLSRLVRYTGHVQFSYSVAQHCCLLGKYAESVGASSLNCLAVLMHDAAEAYIGDVSRPLKALLPDYRAVEVRVEQAIAARYGLPLLPKPKWLKALDTRILLNERAALMPNHQVRGSWESDDLEPLPGVNVEPWSEAGDIERFFLRAVHCQASKTLTTPSEILRMRQLDLERGQPQGTTHIGVETLLHDAWGATK